ncbi:MULTISPECIES: CidA/LrgA family protein [Clostridia]|uniref:CidA/LrgA family protein n=3 Tax=Clostridia TaxID=186801 RepID=A0A8I0DKL4_9CLOT|nr:MULTISPECIES: CidA/LrgA family protein [Clostridia]MBC5639218.1 CidA/LrgA family protein [Clostridium lentum]MBC5653311.1 CidA/LrgA family protein [Blautia lenta]MEE0567296.1 CidA/LrgA family protein [Clostridium sp.]OKZ78140.1 MAG: CidA/LrgA family protein [Clostridium sp. 27_14]
MKLFREAIIIFGIYLLGVLITDITGVPIPGNVIGMVILFLLLYLKVIKVEQISTISNFFLEHLAFFFIPAGVGLISSFSVIKNIWLQLLIVCFVTTAITMICTGLVVQKIANKKEGDKDGKLN